MYNRQNAVEYAYRWWNHRNPKFFNFDSLGGDCTNFVSQCLYAGGIGMNFSPYGWYYTSLNSRAPAWTGVEEFYNFSINNQSSFGVKAKQTDMSRIEIGDIIQLKLINEDSFHHSMIVTKILGFNTFSEILVTCHTFDAKDRPLSYYNLSDVRFLKILN